ncbi:MAG: DUF2207 domain-containing protein, partial [Nitrospirota bacterium]|nr:DUF2207 domain-containing protein [Nitrospirota bacterium]
MKEKQFYLVVVIAVIGIALFFPLLSQTATTEKILFFHSQITVHKDSSMTVSETIKVQSAGIEIKRGIYRDFPTRYKDSFGNQYVVDFNVIEVLRDGKPEGYHFSDLSNGKRIYIGKENVFLSPGKYTYTLVYKTNRQLGFFRDHDELYWNVTGNGWVFPINKASATVLLPQGIPKEKIHLEGYTGPQGTKGKDYNASLDASGNALFSTTKPLNSYEGLTIVVTWPKGFVLEPTLQMKAGYVIRDNRSSIVGLIGLFVLLSYYLIIWFRVGKDPAKGTIMPIYTPPDSFSPSAMRFITKMGFDHKAFAATIINMAVKRFLSIREEDGVYTLIRDKANESVLTPEEKKISTKLLSSSKEIELKTANHANIQSALSDLKNFLKLNFEKIYFITNRKYFFPGLLLSVIIMVLSGFSESTEKGAIVIFLCIWLTGWSLGVTFLVLLVYRRWKDVISGRRGKLISSGGALFLTLFSIPFVAGEIFGLFMLAYSTSLLVIAILIGIVVINYLFYHWLKAPTRAGRKILDKIEGFKMFLSATEKDRLNLMNPQERTPELFEKYLPYAFALDIEQAWTEQFADVLSQAGEAGRAYSPAWYSGS